MMYNKERQEAYAASLLDYSEAYFLASGAVGLRKDAAKYLFAESRRLRFEAAGWSRIHGTGQTADEVEGL